jgi:hypothetical protein
MNRQASSTAAQVAEHRGRRPLPSEPASLPADGMSNPTGVPLLGGATWVQAIIAAEILAPPVALRDGDTVFSPRAL